MFSVKQPSNCLQNKGLWQEKTTETRILSVEEIFSADFLLDINKGVTLMGSLNVGDILFQLMAFLILVVLISGVGMLIKRAVSSDRRLKRMEEKVDELKEEKRRERP
jgi:Na+-transporting methylmalonyl-CoA/oxaloacetate decarboxylase gamma subunit